MLSMCPPEWHEYWPSHVAIGASVTSDQDAYMFIDPLLTIPAPMHFLSVGPMLGELTLERWFECDMFGPSLDWILIEGESQKGARPMDLAWPRKLIKECNEYNVPVFMKQLGGYPDKRDRIDEWPEDLKIRQYPYYFGRMFKGMERVPCLTG